MCGRLTSVSVRPRMSSPIGRSTSRRRFSSPGRIAASTVSPCATRVGSLHPEGEAAKVAAVEPVPEIHFDRGVNSMKLPGSRMKRRTFLKASAIATAGIAAARAVRVAAAQPPDARRQNGTSGLVDPKPLFELSPYLYMQFMEPLG